MAETKEEVIVFTNDSDFGEFIKEGKCVIGLYFGDKIPCPRALTKSG